MQKQEFPHEKDARENNAEILASIQKAADRLFPLEKPPASGLNIRIGGKTIALKLADDELLKHFSEFYAPFITSETPSASIEIARADVLKKERFPTTTVGGDGQRTWLARWDFCALLDSGARSLKGILRLDAPDFTPDALLRIAFSSFFLNEGFMLVHGVCATDPGGGAALFVGPSQSGKSTLAKAITSEATILADDIVAVTENKNGFMAHSTPFWSFKEKEFTTSNYKVLSAPLKACSTLVKSGQVELRKTSLSEGPAALLPNIVYFGTDEAGRRAIFDLAMRLSMIVPFYELHFPKEASPWNEIRSVLALKTQGGNQ